MIEPTAIRHNIHTVRGHRVILDFDLATLYEVENRALKQAVRRNQERFPPDFMFELSKSEWDNLKSQSVISSWGGSRYQPFAFTEQGVAMLSGVLRSPKAVSVNIAIMRAFVAVRQLAQHNTELGNRLTELEQRYDTQFADITEAINYLIAKDQQTTEQAQRKRIGYRRDD